jgi:hypothetical protein
MVGALYNSRKPLWRSKKLIYCLAAWSSGIVSVCGAIGLKSESRGSVGRDGEKIYIIIVTYHKPNSINAYEIKWNPLHRDIKLLYLVVLAVNRFLTCVEVKVEDSASIYFCCATVDAFKFSRASCACQQVKALKVDENMSLQKATFCSLRSSRRRIRLRNNRRPGFESHRGMKFFWGTVVCNYLLSIHLLGDYLTGWPGWAHFYYLGYFFSLRIFLLNCLPQMPVRI